MICPCRYAFFVDGVPVHCDRGTHSGGGTRPVMHQLPQLELTPGTTIETYGESHWCIRCRPEEGRPK